MPSENFKNSNLPEIAHLDFTSLDQLERARGLHEIKRFATIPEMTHRTSVLEHEIRVTNHADLWSLALTAWGETIDRLKIIFYADHHDDPEMEMPEGDIPTPKKRSATPEERAKMEQSEKDAAEKVNRLVQKPLGFRSFPIEFEEYRSQKTLEARIVNYADKWDALGECMHEVICGDHQERFQQAIREYEPEFRQLNEANKDWQDKVGMMLGKNLFEFPDSNKLVVKTPDKLNYRSADAFIKSVTEGNPTSYFWWLRFNKSLLGLDFFRFVFPGWMNKFPQGVLKDIQRVKDKIPLKRLDSGLWVTSTYRDVGNLTFGETLEKDLLRSRIKATGMLFRR